MAEKYQKDFEALQKLFPEATTEDCIAALNYLGDRIQPEGPTDENIDELKEKALYGNPELLYAIMNLAYDISKTRYCAFTFYNFWPQPGGNLAYDHAGVRRIDKFSGLQNLLEGLRLIAQHKPVA